MTFILKTRAITGKLVPAGGEHREYSELHRALADGVVLQDVFGASVFVVDFATDVVVAFI